MNFDQTPDPLTSVIPARRSNRVRNLVIGGAAAAGVLLGAAGIAGAATTNDTSSAAAASAAAATPPAAADGTRPDPASMPNGPGETVLTGTEAEQVTAAALAEIPDGTIIRVETDSSGEATYEAHVQKADGTTVTLLFDDSYTLIGTEDGFGGPGPGGQPPTGQARTGDAPTGTPPAAPSADATTGSGA